MNAASDIDEEIFECFRPSCKHTGPALIPEQPHPDHPPRCGNCGSAEVQPVDFDPPEASNDGEPVESGRERGMRLGEFTPR